MTEKIEECEFASREEIVAASDEYSLFKILQLLVIHDLGEVYIGDIISGDKSEDDEKKERDSIHKLATLDTLPYFSTFDHIEKLQKEFVELRTYNAQLAKDIDILEPLIQLFIANI